jgi:hypothetical protein
VLRFAVLSLLLTAVPITTTVVGHAVDHLEHMGRRMARHRAALDRAPRLRIMPAGLLDGVPSGTICLHRHDSLMTKVPPGMSHQPGQSGRYAITPA